MPIPYSPSLLITRKDPDSRDLFNRYYTYQRDLNIDNHLEQIDFSEENIKLQSLRNVATPDNDLGWENVSYERFIWSYAGHGAEGINPNSRTVTRCTPVQLNGWASANRTGVIKPANAQNLSAQEKLLVTYMDPPTLVPSDDRQSIQYNLARQISNFVEQYGVVRQVAADTSLGLDDQPQEIQNSIYNTFSELRVGDPEADRLIDQFLRLVFAPYPILLPPDPERSKNLWDESAVPEDARTPRMIDRAGVEVPVNPIMHDFNEFKSTLFNDPFPSALQPGNDVQFIRLPVYRNARNGLRAPLQTFLEVMYALMGSTVFLGYNDYAPVFEQKFGTITVQNVWAAFTELVLSNDQLRRQIRVRTTDQALEYQIEDRRFSLPQAYIREYYDFTPETKFVLDYLSYNYITDLLDAPSDFAGSLDFSTIDPQYNYYHEAYEKAIASNSVPEAILPNLYIYDYISENGNNPGANPEWQDDETAAAEISNNFDRLITLGEFEATSIPRLGTNEESRLNFISYLDQYATAATPSGGDDSGVVIDFRSELARDFYNIQTPASQMDIYSKISPRGKTFPMTIGIDFPTAHQGVIGRSIQNTLSSVALTDSLIKTNSTPERMYFYSNGFGYGDDRPVFFTQADSFGVQASYNARSFQSWEGIQYRRKGTEALSTVYGLLEWLENADSEIEGQQNAPTPRERYNGQCPRLIDRLNLQAIGNQIENNAVQNMLSYQDALDNKTAKSENILYKLVKKDAITNETLQNFYFPNTNMEDVIRFVDTQVKYNKPYRYELMGVSVVYGSKFALRPIDWFLDPSADDQFRRDQIYVAVSVMKAPNPKIIEYPIYFDGWKKAGLFGMTLPDVYVYDRPPPAPEILVAPLRGNYRQVMIALQPSNESFLGPRAIPWIDIQQEDYVHNISPSITFQKTFKNYALSTPNLEFSGESASEVKRIEIFRCDMIEDATNERDLYRRSFNGKRIKILDTSRSDDVPPEDRAVSYDFIDTLEPNKRYYYTARSVDVHGKISNPTPIYQVELVFERGTYYPQIDLYEPKYISSGAPTKKMARFLEIKAAAIQSNVQNTFDSNNNVVQSKKSFIERSEYKVENNKFIVRLTSRDTGRKIQFGIKFKSNTTTEET